MEIKQALIFRKDLTMSSGKMVAQGAHAALGAAEKASAKSLAQWREFGTSKIVLTVPTEADFWPLISKAIEKHIPWFLVADAGRTEVEPGTVTCLAIGPGEIDKITSSLPLLKDLA